jgi:hypothetical protein
VRGLCGTNPRRVQTRVISGFLDNDEVPESLLAADALVSITVRNENASPITRRVNAVARPQNEARTSRYQRRGHELGGRGHTTADGIDRLRLDAERATLILLCMEEAPGDCHAYRLILACGKGPVAIRWQVGHGYRTKEKTPLASQTRLATSQCIARAADFDTGGNSADRHQAGRQRASRSAVRRPLMWSPRPHSYALPWPHWVSMSPVTRRLRLQSTPQLGSTGLLPRRHQAPR